MKVEMTQRIGMNSNNNVYDNINVEDNNKDNDDKEHFRSDQLRIQGNYGGKWDDVSESSSIPFVCEYNWR